MFANVDPQTWGNGAEWTASLLGGFALVIALLTLRTEVRSRAEADTARREAEVRVRSAQARKIAFDVSTVMQPVGRDVSGARKGPPWRPMATAVIHNHSEAPIYNAETVTSFSGAGVQRGAWAIIQPGERVECVQAGVAREHSDRPPIAKRLTFVDAEGNFWMTTGGARLEPIDLDQGQIGDHGP